MKNSSPPEKNPEKKEDGRQHRIDGERSRQAILKAAAELATVEGLGGLSIARLADHVGMSKSGLFAHFKSKEDLQLATIDTASATVEREVLQPTMAAAPGIARVEAFCQSYFLHLQRHTFPGGCFFISVAAEFDAKRGPVRDHALAAYTQILVKFNEVLREAQEMGEIDSKEDLAQLAFELDAFMLCVNFGIFFFGDPTAVERGHEAIQRRLQQAMPKRQVGRAPVRGSAGRSKKKR